mmetsp:Transcript_27442/g.30786  ORF Transcript_27442/g.30786 Transcript_27442/m.30786 type:complete len:265 (+) Transcript_27442:3698-4492(+)
MRYKHDGGKIQQQIKDIVGIDNQQKHDELTQQSLQQHQSVGGQKGTGGKTIKTDLDFLEAFSVNDRTKGGSDIGFGEKAHQNGNGLTDPDKSINVGWNDQITPNVQKKQREDRALQEKSYLGQPMRDAHKGTGIKVGVGIPTEVVQVMLEMNGFGWNSCGKNGKPILGKSACNTTIGGGFWTQRSTIFFPVVVVILVILLAVFVSRFDIRLAERIHGDTLLLVAIFVSKSCKFGHYGVNVLVSGFQQRDLFVLCIDRFHKLTQS